MRAIDNYTPQQLETLTLKGMLPERGHFDFEREHEHDLEMESRRDDETLHVDEESEGQ